ncbi:MAG: radical SAM family heme chaperone HemW [Anaerolineales bacterium]|nr:radical SAM family heme chaperone HemW [Anaerolineales bacterium]
MFSLYLHIPFCSVRCAYCDFNTYAGLDELMPAYARALAAEVRLVGEAHVAAYGQPAPVHTIFFGGGTPSLLPLELHTEIFNALRGHFALTADCEITMEANPGTVSRAYLEGARALGFNRLSFGVQSSHPHELRLLDRLHLFGDVAQAVSWARAAGFDNLNLDVIFGLPHQTLAQWQATVHRILGLGPEHISAYALSLEHGTPMRAWVYKGLLPMPDPDLAAEMYEWVSEIFEKHSFVQYEISNWAKRDASPVLTCRHNLQYWRNQPYLGLGAGAHGYAENIRYANVLAPAAYIQRLENAQARPFPLSSAVAQKNLLTEKDAQGETMMMGLRLVQEGVADSDFERRFGVTLAAQYPQELQTLAARGLLEWNGERARLTKAGRLLGNQVFREFI